MADSMDRDMMLANFQAASGVEDLGICIDILEQHDWNLQNALQTMLGSDGDMALNSNNDDDNIANTSNSSITNDQQEQQHQHHHISAPNLPSFESDLSPSSSLLAEPAVAAAAAAGSSSSSSSSSNLRNSHNRDVSPKLRKLHFQVTDDTAHSPYDIIVNETDTVLDIKRQLYSVMPQPISIEDMRLRGFSTSVSDNTVLRRLHLPRETLLILSNANPSLLQSQEREDPSKSQICCSVRNADNGDSQDLHYETNNVNFVKLKSDIYSLWGLPTVNQIWSGVPVCVQQAPNANFANLSVPNRLQLTVKSRQNSTSASASAATTAASTGGAANDDFSPTHEFYDIEDDSDIEIVDETQTVNANLPLIDPNANDEVSAVEQFIQRFSARYSECPIFFNGSLSMAIEESNGQSVSERKPLAIYVHHDKAITANIFCSKVLTDADMMQFLILNFVLWPWDVTHNENATTLVTLVARQLGLDVASRIRMLTADELPVLLIVHKVRSAYELLAEVQAINDCANALSQLLRVTEDFNAARQEELQEEVIREQRSIERQEIVSAYEESLRLDREKDRIRLQEEQLKEEKVRKEREEAVAAEAIVPDEPGDSEPAATIRLRLPGGAGTKQRRFKPQDQLLHLTAYCTSLGFPSKGFRLVTSFPRRVLSDLSPNTTMQEAGLVPQETVLLEEN